MVCEWGQGWAPGTRTSHHRPLVPPPPEEYKEPTLPLRLATPAGIGSPSTLLQTNLTASSATRFSSRLMSDQSSKRPLNAEFREKRLIFSYSGWGGGMCVCIVRSLVAGESLDAVLITLGHNTAYKCEFQAEVRGLLVNLSEWVRSLRGLWPEFLAQTTRFDT